MSDTPAWAPTESRRWTIWFLILGGAGIMAGLLVVPAIIRSAYGDGVFGFLGGLIPGRDIHPVEVYLVRWRRFFMLGLMGLAALWGLGLVVLQPLTWRLTKAAYLSVPTVGGRFERRTVALLLTLVAITVTVQAVHLPGQWEEARGHEYERIATSLADGHGFSFPPTLRWLYEDGEPGDAEYGATAWKEPVYPYFMAASFSVFGSRYGRLAMILAQLGFLVITGILIYRLGSKLFGPGVGVTAGLLTGLLIDLHYINTVKMQVQAISGLLLVGALLLIFRYGEHPGTRRAVWLGLFLGMAALTHAVLIVLVPIAGLFILLHSGDRSWRTAVKPALLMGVAAALVISPWTVRNYVEFGHVIPVQTGFGLFANVSNPYLAETYLAGIDACGDGSPPVYQASGPFDAVRSFRDDERVLHTVHRRTVACVADAHAGEYLGLNEHERDGLHRQQLVSFAGQHPWEFLELTAAKAFLFVFDVPIDGRGSPPLAALGIVGLLLVVRKPRLWVFPLAILAYAAPFALGAPMYFRYQAPLEPLYALLAVVAVVTIFGRPYRTVRRAWTGRNAR
jgi:hypothetical protein